VYRVAVHYWSDHTFGPSLATVRVYVHGVLSYESKDVELEHKDLWEVLSIDWPSGSITPAESSSGAGRSSPTTRLPCSRLDSASRGTGHAPTALRARARVGKTAKGSRCV
jgi:hypothetical protein